MTTQIIVQQYFANGDDATDGYTWSVFAQTSNGNDAQAIANGLGVKEHAEQIARLARAVLAFDDANSGLMSASEVVNATIDAVDGSRWASAQPVNALAQV